MYERLITSPPTTGGNGASVEHEDDRHQPTHGVQHGRGQACGFPPGEVRAGEPRRARFPCCRREGICCGLGAGRVGDDERVPEPVCGERGEGGATRPCRGDELDLHRCPPFCGRLDEADDVCELALAQERRARRLDNRAGAADEQVVEEKRVGDPAGRGRRRIAGGSGERPAQEPGAAAEADSDGPLPQLGGQDRRGIGRHGSVLEIAVDTAQRRHELARKREGEQLLLHRLELEHRAERLPAWIRPIVAEQRELGGQRGGLLVGGVERDLVGSEIVGRRECDVDVAVADRQRGLAVVVEPAPELAAPEDATTRPEAHLDEPGRVDAQPFGRGRDHCFTRTRSPFDWSILLTRTSTSSTGFAAATGSSGVMKSTAAR